MTDVLCSCVCGAPLGAPTMFCKLFGVSLGAQCCAVKRVSKRGEGGKSGVGSASLRRSPCTPRIARNSKSRATKQSLCC